MALLATLKVCRSLRLSDNFSSESVKKTSVTCTSAYYHRLVPLPHSLSSSPSDPPSFLHCAMMSHLYSHTDTFCGDYQKSFLSLSKPIHIKYSSSVLHIHLVFIRLFSRNLYSTPTPYAVQENYILCELVCSDLKSSFDSHHRMCQCVNTNVTSSHSEGRREGRRERMRENEEEGLTCGNKLTCMLQKFF